MSFLTFFHTQFTTTPATYASRCIRCRQLHHPSLRCYAQMGQGLRHELALSILCSRLCNAMECWASILCNAMECRAVPCLAAAQFSALHAMTLETVMRHRYRKVAVKEDRSDEHPWRMQCNPPHTLLLLLSH